MTKNFLISNLLTLLRLPLALLFLSHDVFTRLWALVLALISDFLDGFVARKFEATSKFGAFFDPFMDRFFVLFTAGVLLLENELSTQSLLLLVSRDIILISIGLFYLLTQNWRAIFFKATWFGKITTVSQFFVLIFLVYGWKIPENYYFCFLALGILTGYEVWKIRQKRA